jgi:FG-GAP repeat
VANALQSFRTGKQTDVRGQRVLPARKSNGAITFLGLPTLAPLSSSSRMSNTVTRWKGTHPAIALFVFAVACAMTFGEVSAQAVAAGDFNSDGKLDLVVTLNSPQLSLALLTGTGTGTFISSLRF